jgi:hypothetical protein
MRHALPDKLDPDFLAALGSTKARGVNVSAIAAAMNTAQPGQWASDHRAEASHYTGWNYIGIRTLCLMALEAKTCAYGDPGKKPKPDKKPRTKSSYNEQDDKGEPLDRMSPLMTLLRYPNPYQFGGMFNYERLMQLDLTGTCLVWNVPNALGKVVQRYVIPTAIAEPRGPQRDMPMGGWRISPEISRWAAEPDNDTFMFGPLRILRDATIPAEQMQVVRWPHPIYKDDGQSPLAAASRWTDTADMVDRRRWSQMRQGANPSLVIGVNADSQEMLDRAEEKINKKLGNPEASGRAFLVANTGDSGQPTVTTLTMTPVEMDYQNAFLQFRDSMMALHGCSGMASGTDVGSYAAFYARLLQCIRMGVQPRLSVLAEDDTRHIAPQFGANITIEMSASEINDPEVLEKILQTDLSGKIRTRNEIRLLRGLDPIEGPEGEEFAGSKPAPVPPEEGEEPFGGGPKKPVGQKRRRRKRNGGLRVPAEYAKVIERMARFAAENPQWLSSNGHGSAYPPIDIDVEFTRKRFSNGHKVEEYP